MILSNDPRIDLTYCLNVHPGVSWADHRQAIERSSAAIKREVSPDRPFGLGLRIANRASEELQDERLRMEAAKLFGDGRFYPFTINGFPFEQFHGSTVKEKVYLPDWRNDERRKYTCRLGDLLVQWLPEGIEGSVSTVPGSYKAWIEDEQQVAAMVSQLVATALHFDGIRERTGRTIHLGLEPEPDCFLETTAETVRFFEDELFVKGAREVRSQRGGSRHSAEELLRRHIGVCFDTCHLALQFEDLVESWRKIRGAGIRISKVQISNALEVRPSPAGWEKLNAFVEPVYLHQVKAKRKDGSIESWPDLPAALLSLPKEQDDFSSVRVHFHVPLFFKGDGVLGTTAGSLTPDFFRLLRTGECSHLEIETYTYNVLPDEIRSSTLEESAVREYRWVMENLRF